MLHSHSLAVFQSLSQLIERGFTDVNVYEHHLSDLVKVHSNIRGDDVKKISDLIIEYLLKTLAKQRTLTLDTALIAFFDHICCAFDGNKQSDDEEHENDGEEENLIEKSRAEEDETES